METPIFMTKREKILRSYADANQEVVATTVPYHSTGAFVFDIVDRDPVPSPGVAFAVARANQSVNFFSYGIGNPLNFGGIQLTATDAETNLAKATSTNGAEDFVIEGVSVSCRNVRAVWSGLNLADLQGLAADEDVLAAFLGENPIYDPAGILLPPQVQSPFNLENGMFQQMLDNISLSFQWDRKRTEYLGTLGLTPQGGGASMLRANGTPDAGNYYRIPEGFVWRRDGMADSEFVATCKMQNALVVPLNQLTLWSDEVTTVCMPTSIVFEFVMRIYGMGIDIPSDN